MKLFKLYKESSESNYPRLLMEADTGDRITLFHGEKMPDEYVSSIRGVFHQRGDKIFRNDNPEPIFRGRCISFFAIDDELCIAQRIGSKLQLSVITTNGRGNALTLPMPVHFHVLSDGQQLYVEHDFTITTFDGKSICVDTVKPWGVNAHGCIVEKNGQLWIATAPEQQAAFYGARKMIAWKTYDHGVIVAEREHGLIKYDGKNAEHLWTKIPKEWCVTPSGTVIQLQKGIFSTLDGELVYDGPFYAWQPHPHGVLIERDGNLVLAVVK